MKTLLIPTDFSEIDLHAAAYAAQLGENYNTNFLFVHVYTAPLVTEATSLNQIESIGELLKRDAEELMEKFIADFREKSNVVIDQISKLVVQGAISNIIVEIANDKDVDMIVMSTHGASNTIEKWLGTTAQHVMQYANCPVFIIPETAPIKKPQNIIYAADFKENELAATHNIVDIAKELGAKCQVIHVHEHFEPNVGHTVEAITKELKDEFENENVSINHITRQNIIDGLEKYIETHQPDVLALAHHEKSFFGKIFEPSITNHFVLGAHLPILIFRK
jgi:nucleotide-binding universal stress UspA family protein